MDRSEMMSRIRSRNTLPERVMFSILRRQKIRFIMWPNLPGHPDILVPEFKCCIFVHGCFWHGCPKHFRLPNTNIKFWGDKIFGNIERHNRSRRILEGLGYSVIEIWEHDLR